MPYEGIHSNEPRGPKARKAQSTLCWLDLMEFHQSQVDTVDLSKNLAGFRVC